MEYFISNEQSWNLFDFFLVLSNVADHMVQSVIDEEANADGDSSGANFMFLRVLRVLRLMRLARIVRVLRFFEVLRIMISEIVSGLRSLLWLFVLLGFIMFIFSMAFMQATSGYLQSL